jgi:hypothetical protein
MSAVRKLITLLSEWELELAQELRGSVSVAESVHVSGYSDKRELSTVLSEFEQELYIIEFEQSLLGEGELMQQRTAAISDTKFEEPADNFAEPMQMNLSLQGEMGTGEFSFPAKPFDDVQLQDLIEELRAELKGKIASSLQLVHDGGDIGPVQNFAPDPGSAWRLACSLRPRYRVSGA